jgi:hypothetical protein
MHPLYIYLSKYSLPGKIGEGYATLFPVGFLDYSLKLRPIFLKVLNLYGAEASQVYLSRRKKQKLENKIVEGNKTS